MAVLVLNCGSSSIKFALMDPTSSRVHTAGSVQQIGSGQGDYGEALAEVLGRFTTDEDLRSQVQAVGHRFVHGGEHFDASVVVDEGTLDLLRSCRELAPLHNPANLLGMERAIEAFPDVPHVAVFDTAFHHTLPRYASLYPVPWEWHQQYGVRRFGFHGTSHRFVSREAARRLGRDPRAFSLVTAHLGNGCSTCAVKDGVSIETSMGLTPLDGLMMGTRSGTVDPGLHAHLARVAGMDVNEVTDQLNRKSGLLGVSGVDSDLRHVLEAADQGHERARLAVDMFCYRLARDIGGLAVALDGMDALVFTGGIGENAANVRSAVLRRLKSLGFILDESRNAEHGAAHDGLITSEGPPVALVVESDEAALIARDTWELARPEA